MPEAFVQMAILGYRGVSHAVAGWRAWYRQMMHDAMRTAEFYAHDAWCRYTNKQTGTLIKSNHISQMLRVKYEYPIGEPRRGMEFPVSFYLSGSEKWIQIAEAQNAGARIYRNRAQVLAIPVNPRVTPYNKPWDFPNARWIRSRSGEVLLVDNLAGQGKRPRKPKAATHARKPRKRRFGGDVLYIGKLSVKLREKRFIEKTAALAVDAVRRYFEKLEARLG